MAGMKSHINRRDFIKLSGALSAGLLTPRLMRNLTTISQAGRGQNVLIIVFDALSAMNISFYGYGRKTTPNLAKLSEKAVVYHNHFAGGNFTSPGTASLLTGTHPWTHRAFQPGSRVADAVEAQNIFNVFQGYYRIAYTHNGWAYILLRQFRKYMDELVPQQKLFLESYDDFIHTLFYNDDDISGLAWARNIDNGEGYSYSLFLSHFYEAIQNRGIEGLKKRFPRGIPSTYSSDKNVFLLEQAVDWIGNRLTVVPKPFLGYFHFLPPHEPYRTSIDFYGHFANDGFHPLDKPVDVFAGAKADNNLIQIRTEYDEYILYADQAFGELYQSLERTGLLENTWVIFTSDHGEMFERGLVGHGNPTMYQPLIRVPLLIFEPGRETGENIYAPTSAIDILPTFLHLTGRKVPAWVEGAILPPYSGSSPDPNRDIYVMTAKKNGQFQPFTNASMALVRGNHKLVHCFGYPDTQGDILQLFDIQSDPEELNNLYLSKPDVAQVLFDVLRAKLTEINQPYV